MSSMRLWPRSMASARLRGSSACSNAEAAAPNARRAARSRPVRPMTHGSAREEPWGLPRRRALVERREGGPARRSALGEWREGGSVLGVLRRIGIGDRQLAANLAAWERRRMDIHVRVAPRDRLERVSERPDADLRPRVEGGALVHAEVQREIAGPPGA